MAASYFFEQPRADSYEFHVAAFHIIRKNLRIFWIKGVIQICVSEISFLSAFASYQQFYVFCNKNNNKYRLATVVLKFSGKICSCYTFFAISF